MLSKQSNGKRTKVFVDKDKQNVIIAIEVHRDG
jgi:hypothetical protein